MSFVLSEAERLLLRKAENTLYPFSVTGFLLDPVVVDQVAVGRVYRHVKADPLCGRFADGHLMHTSRIGCFFEYEAFVVLITRNSIYVCVFSATDRLSLQQSLSDWKSRPGITLGHGTPRDVLPTRWEECMKELDDMGQLLYGPGDIMPGSLMSDDEAMEYILPHRNRGVYCIVRDWIWIDVDMHETQRSVLAQTGRQPVMVYAHTVIFDSARRFDVGDFVRTSPLVSFEEGFLFRTTNSTYVLLGEGLRKRAALETVGRIF